MIKNFFLLGIFLFMFIIQSVYAVPAENPYSLKLCSVVLNPWELEWYKLVVFNEDGSNPRIVNEDTCVKWRLYFLPNSINLKDIKIKEIKEEENFFDGTCWDNSPKRKIINKWVIYVGSLDSSCAVIDECTADCIHPDTSPRWTDRYKIERNEDKNKYILGLYNWVDRIDEKNLKEDKLKAWNDKSDKSIDLGYHFIIEPPYNRTFFWVVSYFYPILLWASLIITVIFRLISMLTLCSIYKYKKIDKSIKYLIKKYWIWWIIIFFIVLIIITIILYLRIKS